MPIMAKDILAGMVFYYIDKKSPYPYPRRGVINIVNDNGTVIINGEEYWSWELGLDIHDNDLVEQWVTIIEARIDNLSELLKEVRSYK